ncbi:6048_t:CDS:1, partial [Racocetra fulgida]
MTSYLEGLIKKEISGLHLNFIEYNKFTECQKVEKFSTVHKSLLEECELPVVLKCPVDDSYDREREFVNE